MRRGLAGSAAPLYRRLAGAGSREQGKGLSDGPLAAGALRLGGGRRRDTAPRAPRAVRKAQQLTTMACRGSAATHTPKD
jgi:hypothetical protein